MLSDHVKYFTVQKHNMNLLGALPHPLGITIMQTDITALIILRIIRLTALY